MFKNKYIAPIIILIIGIISIVLAVGILSDDDAGFDAEDAFCIIVFVFGWGFSAFKLYKSGLSKSDAAEYEEHYRELLNGVFEGEENAKSRANLIYAINLYNKEIYKQALQTLKRLKKRCQNARENAAVLLFTALCHSESFANSHAIMAYIELLEQYQPDNSVAWSNLGLIIGELDAPDEDDEEIESESDGDDEPCDEFDFPSAQECYERAIRYNPDNAGAMTNLAQLKIRQGQADEAIELCKRALDIKPTLTQAMNTLYLLCCMAEDGDGAAMWQKMSLEHGTDEDILEMIKDDISDAKEKGLPLETVEDDDSFFYKEKLLIKK